jgi:hypothetical protein
MRISSPPRQPLRPPDYTTTAFDHCESLTQRPFGPQDAQPVVHTLPTLSLHFNAPLRHALKAVREIVDLL